MLPIILFIALLFIVQIWLVAAYSYAYFHTREPVLWLQIAQGALMLIAFGYLASLLFSGAEPNTGVVIAIFGAVVILSVVWRRRAAQSQLIRSYPRGMKDIMFFRRPAIDLKRRVRTR